jgi:hypothetical protein
MAPKVDMMTILIALFGLLIAAACVWGIAIPRQMIDTIIRVFKRPSGMWLAIGVRVVLGVLFILAAPETRYPTFFQVIGYLMLVAAATRFITWFTEVPILIIRVCLLLAFFFGLFVIYAVM